MSLFRRLVWSASALCCAVTLVACGSDDADSATTSSAPSTDTSAAASVPTGPASTVDRDAAAFPMTVTHAYGTITIERRPQRIITLGWLEADIVTSLGVDPIGVSEFSFTQSKLSPWLEAELSSTPETFVTAGQGTELPALNYERLLALKPDLIVATSYVGLGDSYDQLSHIAPVLGPSQRDYAHLSWTDQVAAIGAALGEDEAAQRLIDDTEQHVVEAVASNSQLRGSTYTLALGVPGSLRLVQDPEDGAIRLLDRFGMVLNPRIAELRSLGDGSGGTAVSAENVDSIDADVVLIAFFSDAAKGEWEPSPLFQAVPAVAEGRYLAIDATSLAALRNPSPLSLPYAIDHLVVGGAAKVLS